MAEFCALCGHERDLQKSHIIPKFVGKWIKKTSATGYMVHADNASERVQDLIKYRLLCHDCEERFSKSEKYFADKIFHPFYKRRAKFIEYDNRLELFAISLNWRILKMQGKAFMSDYPNFNSWIDRAETSWRKFLLGNKQSVHPYENYLLFLESPKNVEVPKGFHWYVRGVDGAIAFDENRVFVYVKLVNMVFVSSIHPTTLEGWRHGTRIKEGGSITVYNSIDNNDDFKQFMLARTKLAMAASPGPSPEVSKKRLERAIEKDPERFFASDTTHTVIKEMHLHYLKKMKGMPKSIIALVEEVIKRQVDDPSITRAENQKNRLRSRKIINALANLSSENATKLDNMIRSIINTSVPTQQDDKFNFKTDTIWITFMVNHGATIECQRAMINKEIKMLIAKQLDTKIHMAVFSMKPSNDGPSFESGFLIYYNHLEKF